MKDKTEIYSLRSKALEFTLLTEQYLIIMSFIHYLFICILLHYSHAIKISNKTPGSLISLIARCKTDNLDRLRLIKTRTLFRIPSAAVSENRLMKIEDRSSYGQPELMSSNREKILL